MDVNDNVAKLKIVKFLNESVQTGFYSFNSFWDSSSEIFMDLSNSYSQNQIEIFENSPSTAVLALIRVFDRDSLSNYRFSIQSATKSHEDTTMFQIRSSDRINREFELIATKAFDAELIQNYRLKIVLYDLDPKTTILNRNQEFYSNSIMIDKLILDQSLDNIHNNFQVKNVLVLFGFDLK